MTARPLLALALLIALPSQAAAQRSIIDIDRDIAEYEDTLRKIRDEGWIWIPVPDAGAFISREAEAGIFSRMILLGMLHPDSVAAKHRQYRAMTNVVQAEIASSLELLRQQRRDIAAGAPSTPPPTRPSTPDRTVALLMGTWAVACWSGDVPLNEGGSFSLQLQGDGTVTGAYSGPSGTFNVSGTVDDAGNIAGGGRHPDGTFQYFARIQVVGGAARLLGGNVLFVPSTEGVTCAGGSLTPP